MNIEAVRVFVKSKIGQIQAVRMLVEAARVLIEAGRVLVESMKGQVQAVSMIVEAVRVHE